MATNNDKWFVGDTPVSAAYVGGVQVYSSFTPEPSYEVVAQDEGSWIDGTFTKVFDITNTGNVDLYVAGGLRVPEGKKLTPNETAQGTYTSAEAGKEDTMFLTFTLEDGTLFGTWEEDITTPEEPAFAWTAGVYPTKDGEFRYYRTTGGLDYITFADVPDVAWEVGKDYQMVHSKVGDLGTNTLLDIQTSGRDVRLGFMDQSWGTDGNGIYEVGTTMTLEEVVPESPVLLQGDFEKIGIAAIAPGKIVVPSYDANVYLHQDDAPEWIEAMPIGSDATIQMFNAYNKPPYKLYNLQSVVSSSNSSKFFRFESYSGSLLGQSGDPVEFIAYKPGEIPNG
jgi:hypothetical protein